MSTTTRPVVHVEGGTSESFDFHHLFRLAVHAASSRVIDHFDSEFGAFRTGPGDEVDLDVTIAPFSLDVSGPSAME